MMRIVVCGTGPFAVPTFQWLLRSEHQVVALVTRPIVDAGQRRKSAANPMREVGQAVGLPIYEFPDINAPDARDVLASYDADLLVVCDYGQILSDESLQTARRGGINLHASLLPRYRGSAPIHWAIYRGEKTTGVSVIHMSSRLDGGPILTQRAVVIEPNATTATLEPALAELGVEAVQNAIELLETWDGTTLLGTVQNPNLVTRARRLQKSDGAMRWSRTAQQLHNQVRAFDPWPGTWGELLRGDDTQLRILIRKTEVVPLAAASVAIGQIAELAKDRLVIQTGAGGLQLLEVQPVGKKSLPIADFLRGYRLTQNDAFDPDSSLRQ